MAKAYLGDLKVGNCFLGDNKVDMAYLGDGAVCDLLSTFPTFYIKVWSPTEPIFKDVENGSVSIIDNSDGTWDVISNDEIQGIKFDTDRNNGDGITEVDVISSTHLTTCLNMFKGLINLTRIDFSGFDTSNVINFAGAWYHCSSLTSFPALDTSKGTDFSHAWSDCSSLTSFPALDTSQGTNFKAAWSRCADLVCIPNVNTTSATSKDDMFRDCTSLVQPDAAAQTALTSGGGLDWVNANPCP